MKKIPIYIITGFLGSGKTTFIKNIIKKTSDKLKIGIVQNEFAPANVDSVELKQLSKNFEVLEVNRGSVFCACLFNNFTKSLEEFIEATRPDIIIIEATGLADPISIAELFQSQNIKEKIYLSRVFKDTYPRNLQTTGETS